MLSFLPIIFAILTLGFLVFVHELGHFLVAKWVGMRVEVFSIGFGTPILKWRWKDVDWQVCWLPFGGFVKITGMELGVDKETGLEPHEIPEGFFSQAPWKRIAVALAGPVANFITAFLILTLLWGIGGRVKSFSEFSPIIGWVDPNSAIYEKGVRPGDRLISYGNTAYTSSKDLIHAALMEGDVVSLKGEHIDYYAGTKEPFNYSVHPYVPAGSLNGLSTTGILRGANYLYYVKGKKALGLPIEASGIEPDAQIVWVNGQLIFSTDQLSDALNSERAFLTIKRGDQLLVSQQPLVAPDDLSPDESVKNDWIDWYLDTSPEEALEKQKFLPYSISDEGVVNQSLPFLDAENKAALLSDESPLLAPLQPGDKILSVNGRAFTDLTDLFSALQKPRAVLITKNAADVGEVLPLSKAQDKFEKSFQPKVFSPLFQGIGKEKIQKIGEYTLLKPVELISFNEYAKSLPEYSLYQEHQEKQEKLIEALPDANKREALYRQLEQMQSRKMLGAQLADQRVNYNPSPFQLLTQVVVETLQTLKALFMGSLNPKFLGGPIGIVTVIQHGWRSGLGEALFWIAAISLNLGTLNLLPIPVLDGGYIVLSFYEWITGKNLKAKTMQRLIFPFAVLLIGLLIYLTIQDLTRLFSSLI